MFISRVHKMLETLQLKLFLTLSIPVFRLQQLRQDLEARTTEEVFVYFKKLTRDYGKHKTSLLATDTHRQRRTKPKTLATFLQYNF
jgi:hypothetical protein